MRLRLNQIFKNNKKNKKKYFQSGLTLIEAMAALMIFATAFIIFLRLAFDYGRVLHKNENRLIAYSLAREGLELAMAERNYQWGLGQNWLGSLSAGGNFCINYDLTASSPSNGFCQFYLNQENFYALNAQSGNQSNQSTDFYQKLTAYALPNIPIASATMIVSEVDWPSPNQPNQKIKLSLILTDWNSVQ
ncbi:MAG: hypothetical protein M1505_00545 [Patescibacteria group bacterium]|nr:hypothetical protein [Patescibacteria group bacterium]MCL5257714.1 hypothetical protein [Patescibacteria group bacterium]